LLDGLALAVAEAGHVAHVARVHIRLYM
jgi:hypothetical protein